MKTQACEPCAKRKVRCDRGDPACSNCKRRKQDHCVYPDLTPDERIKRLEETVRALGGDPSLKQAAKSPVGCERTPASTVADAPSAQREDDRSIYLESQGWQAWVNVTRGREGVSQLGPNSHAHRPAIHLAHAFHGTPLRTHRTAPSSFHELPFPVADASRLWAAFTQRVHFAAALSFKWTLKRLELGLEDPQQYAQLSPGERALIITSCYFGVLSLSRDECASDFGRSKSDLLTEHRLYCEDCFGHINMLAIDDIETLKALCLYVKASVDLVTSQSLWSLMGFIGRSAEFLGLHRDGQAVGLTPIETEERRRLWWQVQHLDLIMAVKNGSTPLTFTADWDTKLPLNIDDDDISPVSETLPKERSGLTSFSYTLFTYWVMGQQRKFRVTHQEDSVDQSLLSRLTDRIIAKLESGLQETFLQHCDPVKPLDCLLLFSARGLICILRLRTMHEMRLASETVSEEFHSKYFDLCMQQMGYSVAAYSQPWLKPFQWMGEASFVWHALIAMLVDIPRLADVSRIKAAWTQLSDLYAVAAFLKDFAGDNRRLRAAELIIAAWNACTTKPGMEKMQKPSCVAELEQGVSLVEPQETGRVTETQDAAAFDPTPLGLPDKYQSMSELLEFNFADIEWSYWQ